MDYVALCEHFIQTRFPAVEVAVLGGSTAHSSRTATSDIDLLLIGDRIADDGRESLAATFDIEGELFEVFAYTPDSFSQWAERGMQQYRPVIVQMLVDGERVRGGDQLQKLREQWGPRLDAGPEVSSHELALRRYAVTSLLDDLQDATDDLERNVVAWALFEKLAELMLLANRRWVATGKHLPRRLRELDRDRTNALTGPLLDGDFAAFAARAEDELARAGGRIAAGIER